ncbi:MAG: hypothetical protein AMXMBFR48_22010 [Ignavibacteriales bacterium]
MNISTLTREIAMRQSADFYLRFLSTLPDPDPVLQKTGKGIEAYRELTTDAHLYAAIQQRKAGVLSLPGYIDADEFLLNILEPLLERLDQDALISQILNAPLFGYTVLEIVWEPVYIGSRKWILPARVEEKPQEWFRFDQTNSLRYLSGNAAEGTPLPEKKFLLAQNDATYINPYGEKVLARCYWPVIFKKSGLEFWVMFTERYGLPFVIGKQPTASTEEEQAELLAKLDEMIHSSAAVIPDNSSVDIISFPSGASIDAYRYFLEFMNSEISKAVLTQTLTTELQQRGSYAAARTHSAQLAKLHLADARLAEKTINRMLRWIVEINTSSLTTHPMPRFRFDISSLTTSNEKENND